MTSPGAALGQFHFVPIDPRDFQVDPEFQGPAVYPDAPRLVDVPIPRPRPDRKIPVVQVGGAVPDDDALARDIFLQMEIAGERANQLGQVDPEDDQPEPPPVETPSVDVQAPKTLTPAPPAQIRLAKKIDLYLPRQFRDGDYADEVTLFARPVDGDESACNAVGSDPGGAVYYFECPQSSAEYSAQIAGFDRLEPVVDDELVATIDDDDLVSTAKIVVLPDEGDRSPADRPLTVGADWKELLADREAMVGRYFESIDEAATGAARYCGPLGDDIAIEDLLRGEAEIVIRVDCRFAVADRAGLPADLAEVELRGCSTRPNLGKFCILDRDASDRVRLELPANSPWQTSSTSLGNSIKLADLLIFPDTNDLLRGRVTFTLGNLSAEYEVTAATLRQAGEACEGPAGNGSVVALAGEPLSLFNCGAVEPDTVDLELTATADAAQAFGRVVLLSMSFVDLFAGDIPDGMVALSAMTLNIRAEDDREMPDFFQMQVFASVEDCKARTSGLIWELALTGNKPMVEIGQQILSARDPVFALFNGERPMTVCEPLELQDLAMVEDDGAIIAELPVHFIRPAGPYSIVVLVPTERMSEDGWRNVLNRALRDQVVKLAELKRALATDMFQITESGTLRALVTGEEYVDLPLTGGASSIQGRFDTILYNAAVSQPLAGINLIEANIGDMDVATAVLIVDSTSEKFEPRDSGSLYHWLVNRKINIKIISLGKCDGWTDLSANLDNEIECFDLDDIVDQSGDERVERVAQVLRDFGVLEIE